MFKLKPSIMALSLSAAALLSACGGGGGGSSPSLSGVAAVGAAIVDGVVTAKCSDGGSYPGSSYPVSKTSEDGVWSIATVPATAFPCAVQVLYQEDGNERRLHSYAAESGLVNITPFTDLIVAMAAGKNPSKYFEGPVSLEDDDITESTKILITALEDYGASEDFDPFNTSFKVDPEDPYDKMLDAFGRGLANSEYENYKGYIKTFDPTADELVLPVPAPEDTGGGTTTPGSDTVPANVHSKLVDTYYLNFKQGGGVGCGSTCSFVEDQEVTVVVGADNSLTVAGKKLTNPVNRILYEGSSAHLPEIIWIDGDIEYALSDNEKGTFNEINVGLAKSGGGVPSFIGQLRAAEVAEDPAAKLSIFEGDYAPKYVYKNSSFTLPNQKGTKLALNTNINVSISDKGVISVGIGSGSEDDDEPLVFDPSDESYTFLDNTESSGSMLPNYVVSYKEDDTTIMSLTMSISDGTIVAWKPERLTNNGGGVFSSAYVLLEEEFLEGQEDFIKEFSPDKNIILTAITDSTIDKFFKQCDKLSLEISIPSGQAQYRLGLRGYDEETNTNTSNLYVNILYRDSLKFSSFENPDTLTIKDVRLGKREGTGFIDIDILNVTDLSKVAGKVTNDPAAISEACPE